MVFKKLFLTGGILGYLRQDVAVCDVILSTPEGLERKQMHIAGPDMRTLLDNIEKDGVEASNLEEWNVVYDLYEKLYT